MVCLNVNKIYAAQDLSLSVALTDIEYLMSFAYANKRINSEIQNKTSTPSKHPSSKNNDKYVTNSNQDFILHLQKYYWQSNNTKINAL